MLRILFLAFDVVPSPKGASVHILQWARALADGVGPVDLLTVRAPGQPAVSVEGALRTVRVDLPEGNFLRRVEAWQAAVAGRLQAEQYEHVHFRDVWSGLPALARAGDGRCRTVFEVNGLPSFELASHHPAVADSRRFVRKLRAQEIHCMLRADRVVTPSPVTRDYMVRVGLLPWRLRTIPNGVDGSAFRPPADGPARAVPRLLYVGTLAPWQGVATLLAAVKKVLRERPVELTVVGRGRKEWLVESLRLARRLKLGGAAAFLGEVPQERVAELVREADLCLAPLARVRRNTRQGCCPLKLLEYQAAGRPFVASDLPVVRAVLPEGCEAFLARPGKAGEVAERVLWCLEHRDEALALARRLRENVLTNFSWQRSNDAVVALHRELAGGGSGCP